MSNLNRALRVACGDEGGYRCGLRTLAAITVFGMASFLGLLILIMAIGPAQ